MCVIVSYVFHQIMCKQRRWREEHKKQSDKHTSTPGTVMNVSRWSFRLAIKINSNNACFFYFMKEKELLLLLAKHEGFKLYRMTSAVNRMVVVAEWPWFIPFSSIIATWKSVDFIMADRNVTSCHLISAHLSNFRNSALTSWEPLGLIFPDTSTDKKTRRYPSEILYLPGKIN